MIGPLKSKHYYGIDLIQKHNWVIAGRVWVQQYCVGFLKQGSGRVVILIQQTGNEPFDNKKQNVHEASYFLQVPTCDPYKNSRTSSFYHPRPNLDNRIFSNHLITRSIQMYRCMCLYALFHYVQRTEQTLDEYFFNCWNVAILFQMYTCSKRNANSSKWKNF